MKRLCALLCLSFFSVSAVSGAGAQSWNEIDWFDDAAGYARAVSLAQESGDPVLVYFYADWCPYCRQLNTELLADADVQAQVGKMLAVRVNAEAGPDERSLAGHYRVRGYPALYLYTSAQGGSFAPIRRTTGGDSGAVRLKTSQEFVETLRGDGP